MVILNQRDYPNTYLGKSKAKVSDYGCLITCISMALSWYVETFKKGKWRDPKWLAKNLTFTKTGLLYWNSITKSDLPIKFVYRYYSKNDSKCLEILKSTYNTCILQVDYNHWVFLIGYSRIKGMKIADPYYGDITYLPKRNYKITGFAELTLKQ